MAVSPVFGGVAALRGAGKPFARAAEGFFADRRDEPFRRARSDATRAFGQITVGNADPSIRGTFEQAIATLAGSPNPEDQRTAETMRGALSTETRAQAGELREQQRFGPEQRVRELGARTAESQFAQRPTTEEVTAGRERGIRAEEAGIGGAEALTEQRLASTALVEAQIDKIDKELAAFPTRDERVQNAIVDLRRDTFERTLDGFERNPILSEPSGNPDTLAHVRAAVEAADLAEKLFYEQRGEAAPRTVQDILTSLETITDPTERAARANILFKIAQENKRQDIMDALEGMLVVPETPIDVDAELESILSGIQPGTSPFARVATAVGQADVAATRAILGGDLDLIRGYQALSFALTGPIVALFQGLKPTQQQAIATLKAKHPTLSKEQIDAAIQRLSSQEGPSTRTNLEPDFRPAPR